MYVNAFLNGSVKHYKKVNARRIYWTGKEKTLAREHLDKHFGICNAYVRADDGGGNGEVEYYATSPFAMMWDYVIGDELKTTVWKDQKNEERKRSFLSKMADKFFTNKKKGFLYYAQNTTLSNVNIYQQLTQPDCVLRSSDYQGLAESDGWELQCHVAVLIAWSDVFKKLLLGSWNDSNLMDASGKHIVIVNIEIVPNIEVMQILLSGMYVQSLSMCGYDVQTCVNCRGAAEYFQLEHIVRGCDEAIVKSMDDDTCLGIMDWAQEISSCQWVYRLSKRYLRQYFVDFRT